MTLTELKYVVAVAREGHFGRAAERCFVSQPTLSVAVRKLEDELDVVLFERRSHEVTVTPIGRRVVEQAQLVLEEAAVIKQMTTQSKDHLGEPLRLGAIYTVGPYLLPALIPSLRARAPGMPLRIEEDFTGALRERLRQGELDAILVSLPFTGPGLETRPLYDEPLVVVLPVDHPLTVQERIDARDLDRERLLVLGPGHCLRDQVLAACPGCANSTESSTVGIDATLVGGSLEMLRHMAATGLGVTVLPAGCVGDGAGGLLAVKRFAHRSPKRRVALAWRRSFTRPRAIEALCDAILEAEVEGVEMLRGPRAMAAGGP